MHEERKTIDDLMAELKAGKKKLIAGEELERARDYERSLLPADTRFPARGDVYEAIEDLEVDYITSWAAPFTGGGRATLRRGERVTIQYAPPNPPPVMVYAAPVQYKAGEARVVPEADRKAPKYGGFAFALKTSELNTKFRLVQGAKRFAARWRAFWKR
jgi:hypothetical protein